MSAGPCMQELGAAGGDGEEREGRALALGALARTSPELVLAAHAGRAMNGGDLTPL